jgi:hypothetical protein
MAENSTPLFVGKVTFGYGETVSLGVFGAQGTVTYNRDMGEAQANAQAALGIYAVKYSQTESGVWTVGLGLGNVYRAVRSTDGISDFVGFIYNSQYGLGMQIGAGLTGPTEAPFAMKIEGNWYWGAGDWKIDAAGEVNGANYNTGFTLPDGKLTTSNVLDFNNRWNALYPDFNERWANQSWFTPTLMYGLPSVVPNLEQFQQYQQLSDATKLNQALRGAIGSVSDVNQSISDYLSTLPSPGAAFTFNDYGLSALGWPGTSNTPGQDGTTSAMPGWWNEAPGPSLNFPSFAGTSDGSGFGAGAVPFNDYGLNGFDFSQAPDPFQGIDNFSSFPGDFPSYSYGSSDYFSDPFNGNDYTGYSYNGNDYASYGGSDYGAGYYGGGDYGGGDYGGGDYAAGDGGFGYAPVVLDISGNGINITQLSSSNTYQDINGNGDKSLTAWAGAGNGVLVLDLNHNGVIDQKSEIEFETWDPTATTDMQALLDVFDTNHDGKLDAGDAHWSDFKVMVTNADGTTQLETLAQLNITSIDLTSNRQAISLPDGSSIDGETTFTRTDGTTGAAPIASSSWNAAGWWRTATTTSCCAPVAAMPISIVCRQACMKRCETIAAGARHVG